jgi:hypothetical protein
MLKQGCEIERRGILRETRLTEIKVSHVDRLAPRMVLDYDDRKPELFGNVVRAPDLVGGERHLIRAFRSPLDLDKPRCCNRSGDQAAI